MANANEEPSARRTGGWSEYYASDYDLPFIHEHLGNMADFIARCRAHFPGKRIIEVGTGTGIVSVYFSQLGYAVTGLDADAGVVRKNQRLNRVLGGRARFVVGDMFHLPFRKGTFDACFHQGLLEHFDPPEILAALRIQTEIAGRVVFSVPTVRWRGGLFGDERLWPASEWLTLLGEFRVLDVFGGAYRGLAARTLHFAAKRISNGQPRALFKQLALARAGEIGFVIERR